MSEYKTPFQVAKELHADFLKDKHNVAAELKLMEYLAEYSGDDKIVHSTELVDQIEALENEPRYYTGIEKLDEILDGFRGNQLVAVSAPSKAGKTQFCIHLARSLPNPTMFLFEESAAEVLYKYKKKGLALPNFYSPLDFHDQGVDYLYRKMLEAWAKHDSKIFFIDHLHYLIPDEGKELMTYKIKRIVQDLKQLAKTHGFTIFLVAHISHQSYDEPPGIQDIRDSSFIVQYADTTLMLWRETYNPGARGHKKLQAYTNNLLINIPLNRKINFTKDYNTGIVDLAFNTDTWEYEESEWYTEWIEDGRQKDTKAESAFTRLSQLD